MFVDIAETTVPNLSYIYSIAISQIAENMENEHFVFQEMEDLSISQTMDQYLPGGVFNLDFPMCDEKFDLNEVDHSRFVNLFLMKNSKVWSRIKKM